MITFSRQNIPRVVIDDLVYAVVTKNRVGLFNATDIEKGRLNRFLRKELGARALDLSSRAVRHLDIPNRLASVSCRMKFRGMPVEDTYSNARGDLEAQFTCDGQCPTGAQECVLRKQRLTVETGYHTTEVTYLYYCKCC